MALLRQRQNTRSRGCAGQEEAPLPGTRREAPRALLVALLGRNPPFHPQRRRANGGKPLRAEGMGDSAGPDRRLRVTQTPGPQGLPAASPWTGSKLLNLTYLSHCKLRTIICKRLK